MHPRESDREALLCIQRGLPMPKKLSERLKDLDINIQSLLEQERQKMEIKYTSRLVSYSIRTSIVKTQPMVVIKQYSS